MALSLLAGNASVALAASVSSDGGPAMYVGDPGENNAVTITCSGIGSTATSCDTSVAVTITYTDDGTTSTGGPITVTTTDAPGGCAVSGNTATCVGPFSSEPFNYFRPVVAELADGDDTLVGSQAGEGLGGGAGENLLDPGIGNDFVIGGLGSDTVSYAARTTPVKVEPQPGSGGTISDTAMFGGDPGPDGAWNTGDDGERDAFRKVENFIGGQASDFIIGDQDPNVLNGGPGGSDVICGGLGRDTVDYSTDGAGNPRMENVTVTLDGTIPTDPRTETPEVLARENCVGKVDHFPGELDCVRNDGAFGEEDCVGEDIENVIGGSGNDTLIGNVHTRDCPNRPTGFCEGPKVEPLGENILIGGPGDDILDGLDGADQMVGDPGTDTVDYSARTDPVVGTIDGVVNDGGLADFNAATQQHDFIKFDVERVKGGAGSDTLGGDESNDILEGAGGNDLIDGGGGADDLSAGPGDDTVRGNSGNDDLLGEDGNDHLDGGEGSDNLDGGADNDNLYGSLGADLLDGGAGTDSADYRDYTTRVSVTPDGVANDGSTGEGDNVADTVEGAIGGSDDDTLSGNGGAGTLNGGEGDDVLDGAGGPDTLTGGPGADTASYASAGGPVSVTIGSGADDGQAGEGDDVQGDVEKVSGTGFADTLTAGAGGAVLKGLGGSDNLIGGAGTDLLQAGDGNDTLDGGGGRDELSGEGGNDNLKGGPANDTLHGGPGNDALEGGANSDVLNGNGGTDTAMYNARSKNVNVSTNGVPDDGERGEGDIVRSDVESTKTGSGDDWVKALDGKAGDISCGPGEDHVKSDPTDKVSSDCEFINQSSSRCRVAQGSVRMKRTGSLSVRVRCAIAGAATLRLRSKSTLGSKKFTARSAKSKTVKVKLSRKARRSVLRRKSLRVTAVVTVRPKGVTGQKTQKSKRSTRALTIRAPKGR